MKYSIIIPVFNKVAFTKRCLDTLQATLAGAGDGEVIVIDNASSDETPELLETYPWIRHLRNELNLGFAGANNQAARAARGEFLILLNNDTEAFPGWLAAMLKTAEDPSVGAVGARLLFENGTIQHAGVVVARTTMSRTTFVPFHHNSMVPHGDPDVNLQTDFQIVTGACLMTPRALYRDLGGLDETFWNGYEDVDYCLKVRARGLRVVYEPKAKLFHFESQSGVQRFRKSLWNTEMLAERWRGKVIFDGVKKNFRRGCTRRATAAPHGGSDWSVMPLPAVTVLVHGSEAIADRVAFERSVRSNDTPIAQVIWASQPGCISTARDLMELRGNRAIAFVDVRAKLRQGWLDELLSQCEGSLNTVASTAAPEQPHGDNLRVIAADARCSLIRLDSLPAHIRLRDFDTLDGSVADLTLRCIELGIGTRGAAMPLGAFPAVGFDASFEAAHGMPLPEALGDNPEFVERSLERAMARERRLVSIVTLSWNAPQYTKMALDSIRDHTSEPYEVIVVDNGSQPETLAMLAGINDPHVRIIYNGKNLGFGGGNNVGIAASRGDYVIVLNNDVIVTDEWVDRLVAPFARVPCLGISAPRSNKVTGHQQLHDAQYAGMEGVHDYARDRRLTWDSFGYVADRAIGLCLCIDRTVINEIGGFDERFRFGNFEDDDLCLRVRAAGYKIYICDDVFIHHFGSRSFAANKLDYVAIMAENGRKFSEKWNYTATELNAGYNPRTAIARGFDRERHFAPLPCGEGAERPVATAAHEAAFAAFHASVTSERDWQELAQFIRRYMRAFTSDDGTVLRVAAFGDSLGAAAIGKRIERLAERAGVCAQRIAEIEVSDEEHADAWQATLPAHSIDAYGIEGCNPSALRRILVVAEAV
ncbi:MAG: glycosyltransferase family 2 protein [Candidatus Eremiobacteraeota bacterium]|nr:glycosyltransferase family 2 protein [Candidatus Eremiobacteraeota bacterium]